MCGIVGILYKDPEMICKEETILKMRDSLVHRGPDEEGIYLSGNVGLGHRRLSIIDLSTGRQPMTNEDGTLWIVFNGEIYNFQEIRESLVSRGHIFKTKSDTEVILHLYEEKGEACPASLNGIFAFAIWDQNKQSLLLARDHMGIKPLYYAATNDAFLFSSEIKSIIKSGHVLARCNEDVIPEYFLFRHVSGENTLYHGVKSLLPGNSLLIKNGNVIIKEYWSPFPKENNNSDSFDSAAEELSWLVKDAIKMQMISDVPLGTFCSGGIDSSLVTAVASQLVSEPINTFSVGFHEEGYDETSYARTVSKQCGTYHHEIRLTSSEFAELLPKMIWHNDEPLNFANSVQIYAISKLAKETVTVVLTGEGADELFGGYPRYYLPKLAAGFRAVPALIRNLLLGAACSIGGHRVEKIARFAGSSENVTLLFNSAFVYGDFLTIIAPEFRKPLLSFRENNLLETERLALDRATRVSLLDQQNYLVSILNRQDKMSMAASIESRVPLLDFRIVELANRMSSHHKMNFFRTKVILKHVGEKHLPRKILDRKKSGFGVPLGKWFKETGAMAEWLDEMSNDLPVDGIIDSKRFSTIVEEHRQNHKDHSEALWTCLNFWLWDKTLSKC